MQNSSPKSSPVSALSLLRLPFVRNPGSSAGRSHPRWLFCPWLGAACHRVTACRRLWSRRRVAGCRSLPFGCSESSWSNQTSWS
ncbi:uncharacterized protein DS421_4g118780 [Arachis hypogaea]|nr:uncharacterized protein DS421_4g118780 [Arachis hypogaea]